MKIICKLYAGVKGMAGNEYDDFADKVCGYYYQEVEPECKTLVGDDIGFVADAIPKPCKEY